MFYILGLFLLIGFILSGFSGALPFDFLNTIGITGTIGDALNNLKKKTYEFIFPDSENEILVENLKSNYDLLDRFFSESSGSILESKDISKIDKEALQQAIQTFNKTKDQIKILGQETKKNEPGILGSLIKRALDINSSSKNEDNLNNLNPTYIPPSCRLECGE